MAFFMVVVVFVVSVAQVLAPPFLSPLILDDNTTIVHCDVHRLQIRLLVCGNRESKNAASGAILELAFDEKSRVLICESGGVAPLIEILRTGSVEGREAAAGALCNLSISPK